MKEKKRLYEKEKKDFKQKLLKENPQKWENHTSYILKSKSGVFYENKIYPQDYTFSTKDYLIKEADDQYFERLREKFFALKKKVTKENTTLLYIGEVYPNKKTYELYFEDSKFKENGKREKEMPDSIKFKINSNLKTFFKSNNSTGVIILLRCQPKNIILFVNHSNMKLIEESVSPAFNEFELAWQEFFNKKPRPKNDEEEKKQSEEFHHWYNHVRKQSDTGKTPAEMYKEIYGKEPPKNPSEVSRMMNFEWDENYREPDEMLREADYLISKGKNEQALKCVDGVLEITGDDDEVLLIKIEILNNLGRYKEAEEYLKKIEKKDNLKAYASFYRAQRYMFEGNFIRHLKYMKGAYEQEPNNFDFVIGMANSLYIENDRYYKEYLDKARKIDKKRAEKFLKKYWLEPKEMVKGRFLISVLDCSDKLMEEGKIEEAEKNLNLLTIYGHYLDKGILKVIRGLQIECLFLQKRFDKAEIKIDELIKIDKNNPHAYFYKSQLLYENSKFDEALNEIDKCIEASENGNTPVPHPDFFLLKSMILKKLNNDEYLYYENKAEELMKGLKEFQKNLKNGD